MLKKNKKSQPQRIGELTNTLDTTSVTYFTIDGTKKLFKDNRDDDVVGMAVGRQTIIKPFDKLEPEFQ